MVVQGGVVVVVVVVVVNMRGERGMCRIVSEALEEPESRGKTLCVSRDYRLRAGRSIGDGRRRKESDLMMFGDGLGADS